jgi:hypothetical protein
MTLKLPIPLDSQLHASVSSLFQVFIASFHDAEIFAWKSVNEAEDKGITISIRKNKKIRYY